MWRAYQNHGCCVAESVEVHEISNVTGKTEKGCLHDVGEVAGECLHVITRFGLERWCHPVLVSLEHSALLSTACLAIIKQLGRSRCVYGFKSLFFAHDLPIVFRSLYQIINLRVYQLENSLLGRLLVSPELFGCIEDDRACSRCRRACSDEQFLQLLTGRLEVFEIDQYLDNLTQILGA